MLVHNKGDYTRVAVGVTLIPGANNVDATEYKGFAAHPIMKKLIDSGEIVAQNGLKDLNADEAIKLVEDTYSVEYLEGMKAEEKRKTVLEAITKQIEAITNPQIKE